MSPSGRASLTDNFNAPLEDPNWRPVAGTGIDVGDLRQAFDQPNEIAEPITRFVVADDRVGSGRGLLLNAFSLGPRAGDRRRILIEWEGPHVHSNVEPERRGLEGDWRRP